VTPGLVALNVTVFVLMLRGAGALGDAATLIGWGGNLGTRTTNGEWWRLLTSIFLHSSMLHLLVSMAALVQLGLILERLVGPFVVATVYVTAGTFASLVSISARPLTVSVGDSGAIFGLYGLLIASSLWGMYHRSAMTIPLHTVKRSIPLPRCSSYAAWQASLPVVAGLTGLSQASLTGWFWRKCSDPRSSRAGRYRDGGDGRDRRGGMIPMQGIADVKPEMERVVAWKIAPLARIRPPMGSRKAGFVPALALLIDRTIMPELQAADARVKALDRVPLEDQPLVANAEEYLRLRAESWRLRVEGLRNKPTPQAGNTDWESAGRARLRAETQHKVDGLLRGKAEGTERASLEALQKIKPVDQQ
jgi:hypothetical protein